MAEEAIEAEKAGGTETSSPTAKAPPSTYASSPEAAVKEGKGSRHNHNHRDHQHASGSSSTTSLHSKRRERAEAAEALHDATAEEAVKQGRKKGKARHWRKKLSGSSSSTPSSSLSPSSLLLPSLPALSVSTSKTVRRTPPSESSPVGEAQPESTMPAWKRQQLMKYKKRKEMEAQQG